MAPTPTAQNYEPDVTSYDYDSVLDESGRPTPKYFVFRDLIAKATGDYTASSPDRRCTDERA